MPAGRSLANTRSTKRLSRPAERLVTVPPEAHIPVKELVVDRPEFEPVRSDHRRGKQVQKSKPVAGLDHRCERSGLVRDDPDECLDAAVADPAQAW